MAAVNQWARGIGANKYEQMRAWAAFGGERVDPRANSKRTRNCIIAPTYCRGEEDSRGRSSDLAGAHRQDRTTLGESAQIDPEHPQSVLPRCIPPSLMWRPPLAHSERMRHITPSSPIRWLASSPAHQSARLLARPIPLPRTRTRTRTRTGRAWGSRYRGAATARSWVTFPPTPAANHGPSATKARRPRAGFRVAADAASPRPTLCTQLALGQPCEHVGFDDTPHHSA
jgi:hypothetical protein